MRDYKDFISLIAVLNFIFLALPAQNICFAQEPAKILKSQEELEKEKALRKKIKKQEKVFIKKIILHGVSLVSKEEIKNIILSYQKHWLSKEDIRQIIILIQGAYKNKGYKVGDDKIYYLIKKGNLIIKVKEELIK